MKEIRIFAMMRSGHHAVINWLFEQLPGNVLFINRILGRRVFYENYSDAYKVWNPDFFIYNFEDETPEIALNLLKRISPIFNLGKSPVIDILVLRDPYNLFASRIKMESIIIECGRKNTSPVGAITPAALKTWKTYAREFIRKTNILSNPICLNYNSWVQSIAYRKSITDRVGCCFTDDGINEVPTFGGGSSFDGETYQNNAQAMQLNERYKDYEKHDWFINLFDDEIKSLSHQIFNFAPFPRRFHKLFL